MTNEFNPILQGLIDERILYEEGKNAPYLAPKPKVTRTPN